LPLFGSPPSVDGSANWWSWLHRSTGDGFAPRKLSKHHGARRSLVERRRGAAAAVPSRSIVEGSETMQAHHQMQRTQTREGGAEEWWCPTCGRRLLLRWPPQHQKLVLEPGDELATHAGATRGLRLGSLEVVAANDPQGDPGSDWRRWLADNGMDWDGPAA
jgi:hypothetical protein